MFINRLLYKFGILKWFLSLSVLSQNAKSGGLCNPYNGEVADRDKIGLFWN